MSANNQHKITTIRGCIRQGHRIASGDNPGSPYPAGSIQLQKPFFKSLGLDLTGYFNGTLNVDIAPKRFALLAPEYTFRNVKWMTGFPAEDFSFVTCQLEFRSQEYSGWIYYPHPDTKTQHFHNDSLLELLMPPISEINYGDVVRLAIRTKAISIS